MENFIAYNPVKLYFGKNVLEKLPDEVKNLGKKALLITGKGSVKKFGYFNQVKNQLEKSGIEIVHFEGIKPNPTLKDAEKAVALAKEHQIDFVVALGGGSVIDTAKMLALAYANNQPVWDLMKHQVNPTKKIPLITILTLAATGTEMNAAAVLQNHQTQEKIGYFNPLMYPKASFLDPAFTLTVPKNQTINGIVDLVAHSLEAYFSGGDAPLSDRFVSGIILETRAYAPKLLSNLSDYNLRARMMWAATVAENGTTMHGRATTGDWGTHALAHHISLLWDTPHGQTLSIIFPAWMKALKYKISDRLENLGKLITGKETTADETIAWFESFFARIGAPLKMSEIGLQKQDKEKLLALWNKNKPNGMHINLTEEDYQNIIQNI